MIDVERKRFREKLRQRKLERFKNGAKKRVALLMRVSDRKQAYNDEVPIPVQREKLLEMISEHPDWVIARDSNGNILEYTEVSSAFRVSRSERKMLQKALHDAENDMFDIILFFKHDRLSRISHEYTSILQDFWECGVEPWDYERRQPLTVKSQLDKLVRFIEGWQSETESVNTSFRVTETMQAHVEKGNWMGGKPPYGYKYSEPKIGEVTRSGKSKKKVYVELEPDPNEASMVKLIFELYVKGYGSERICEIINNPPYNFRKRNGKPFDPGTILSIIKNPIYIGYITWGKTTNKDGYTKRLPKEKWIFSQERVSKLQIIDDNIWETAQQLREERAQQAAKGKKIARRTMSSERLLAGLAFCGACNEPLLSHLYSTPRKNYRREGYLCRNRKRKVPCEGPGFIEKSQLDGAVLKAIRRIIEQILDISKDSENEIVKKIKDIYKRNFEGKYKELQILEEEVNRLKKLRDFYVEEYNKLILGEKVSLPEDIIREQIKRLQEEYNAAVTKRDEAKANVAQQQQLDEKTISQICNFIEEWNDEFWGSNIIVQRTLLRQLIKEVKVYKDKIEIYFQFSIKDISDETQLFVLNQIACTTLDGEAVGGLNEDYNKFNCASISVAESRNLNRNTINDNNESNKCNIKYRWVESREQGTIYWQKITEWEEKYGRPFEEILFELRRTHKASELPGILGISRGFLYYHFSHCMDKIRYLENKMGKSLREIIIDMRNKGKTMHEISNELGLALSTLYNHVRK